ncbi:MFS transporter [Rhizorhabdus argentea]|uniref:MFS transporter n=1 Tax=Rhizorhabdus argentea TaxID=1387174 RepID=UPI0030EBE515
MAATPVEAEPGVVRDARAEWRSGWPIAFAAAGGIFTAVLYVYSTGLFLEPLANFGWSRVDITSGMLIVGVVAAFGNPFIGLLVDRVGPGRISAFGVIAYAIAMAALGLTGPNADGWRLGWVAVAFASLAISVPVWLVAVARHFDKARGMALAIGYCGSSIAALSVPWITQQLIEHLGWRAAYAGIGLLALTIGGAASLTLLRAGGSRFEARPAAGLVFSGSSLRVSLGSTRFWRIALMSLIVTIGVIGLTVHFVPICVEHGIWRETGASLAGLIGIAGLAGRLGTGWLLDRLPGTLIGAVLFSIPALACLLLWQGAPGMFGMAMVAIAVGVSLGAELDIMAYLTTRYFGLGNYGFLFGILTGIVGCAAGFGPLLASALRDRGGDYAVFAQTLFWGFLLSVLIVATLGRYDRGDPLSRV